MITTSVAGGLPPRAVIARLLEEDVGRARKRDGRPFLRWKVDGVLQTIGLRTLEVEITSDVNLKALYRRLGRIEPKPPTEDHGDME